ncbi:iron ABC transporter permease [Fervidobacterium pennivorans subsp. shakshaketiis]|uniref:ABC-type Fe3+-siderophore transport system, permease component n=1 Tax=Fervidobacterium pennivorans (strain DSM 9078 / Ven5) TaxID=771875 RepID=H9UBL9_FERPD|nr:iron ABC transporter permease [Fervidobacterium pennivorans]AFG34912.1 ABC-type Fe3+-siderophore transport system, permease component [Fervidobacterium pennivorans DSM 9078]QIV78183.1 iron ABC transporter permease [Fervidobacterium pennivorans subsp. keratinolyticus]
MSKNRNWFQTLGRYSLPFVFVIVFVFNLSFGTVYVSPLKIFQLLRQESAEKYMIWNLRFPRVLMATLTGIALSLVGNIFQAIMKNPLVDPYLIGTSAGASFGALLAIYFIVNSIAHVSIPTMSFIFAVIASSLSILLAKKGNVVPTVHLVLSGVLVSTLFSAGSMLLLNIANKSLVTGHVWLYGSFSGMTFRDLIVPASSLGVFVTLAFTLSKQLDAMTLGEKEAKSLGINVEALKWTFYLLGSFVTATFVSKTGIIGFVGLVVPHMARIIAGPKHSKNLLATVLIGGILMSVCDTLARTLLNPVEIPVGIITSFIGAPFMFVLLKWKNGVAK